MTTWTGGSSALLADSAASEELFGRVGGFLLFVGLSSWVIGRVRTRAVRAPHGSSANGEVATMIVDVDVGDLRRRSFYSWQALLMVVSVMAVPTSLLFALERGERSDLITGLVVAAGALVGYRLRRRRAPIETDGPLVRGWLKSGRRQAVAWTIYALSYFLLVLALLAAAQQIRFGTLSEADQAEVARSLDVADPNSYYVLLSLGSLVGVVVLARFARRVAHRAAADLIARDERQPVLLLRGFEDDRQRVGIARGRYEGVGHRIGLVATRRLEEVLAGALSLYGPVIALAQPGKRLQPIGAARESISSPAWLEIVRERTLDAAHIVVVVGSNRPGSGLAQELDMLREADVVEKITFVMPPVGGDAGERWQAVASAFGVDRRVPKQGAVVAFQLTTAGAVTRFVARQKVQGESYESAIESAFLRSNTESVPAAFPAPTVPAAGWYPDPDDAARLRWWDGSQWTAAVGPQAPRSE